VEQALALAHTRDREMCVEFEGYRGPGIAVKLSRTPGSVRLAPPRIGEHSEAVLARFGYTAQGIAGLFESGVVR
jgi:crotonobetainyl-CoA:carnitine CoA-transferase CaiB-like acyl-CoA transferase